MRILVTGGAGFIGSALVRQLVADPANTVTTVDKLTYASNLDALAAVLDEPNHHFEQVDIVDGVALRRIFAAARPEMVFHLAAESHVDRSIASPRAFIDSNIVGTFTLLTEAVHHYRTLTPSDQAAFRFLHVSTDEVFGSLGADGYFTEETAYDPSSPYSASKAAADHLVRAWHRTYGLPVLITNCSNNYGPYQFPEKLIPHLTVKALTGEPLPVYGAGENVRDWLHVDDHAAALRVVAERGCVGETYVVSANGERRNIDLVRDLCAILDSERPRADGGSYADQIVFVTDRPGHDFRYAIDATKLRRDLGWQPAHSLADGLRDTVRWYLANESWWRRILTGAPPAPSYPILKAVA